jgi:hypothetical protein
VWHVLQLVADPSSLPEDAEMPWERIPDPTPNKAFACPTAHIRLIGTKMSDLDLLHSAEYFETHRSAADALRGARFSVPRKIVPVELIYPPPSKPFHWDVVPETAAERKDTRPAWKRIGWSAAYVIAILTHHGNLRASDVPQLVERIVALDPSAVRGDSGITFSSAFVDAIANYISANLPAFYKCNNGKLALQALAQIEGDSEGASNGAKNGNVTHIDAAEAVEEERKKEEDQQSQMRTRRAIITPTRLLPLAPALEASNRILRQCVSAPQALLEAACTVLCLLLYAPG